MVRRLKFTIRNYLSKFTRVAVTMSFVFHSFPLEENSKSIKISRGSRRSLKQNILSLPRVCLYCSVHQEAPAVRSTHRESTNSKSKTTGVKNDQVIWYFAYGSNLSPKVFGPHSSKLFRRFRYLKATKAQLSGYRLCFNVRGIPIVEPCFANIKEDIDGTVSGVLYKLNWSDWKRLSRSEGIGITGAYKERVVKVLKEDDGQAVLAFTLVAEDTRFVFAEEVMPSSRYLGLLSDGLAHWKLNSNHPFLKSFQSATSQPAFPIVNHLAGSLPEDLVAFSSVAHWETGTLRFLKVPDEPSQETEWEKSQVLSSDLSSSSVHSKAKPLLLYLPGIDGTGLGILPQLDSLRKHFHVRCLVWPSSELYSWHQLVDKTLLLIDDVINDYCLETFHSRESAKVWLVAESMGCCLALLLAERRPHLFEHVTLVNPATSYSRSVFSRILSRLDTLPSFLYQIAPVIISPLLLDFGRRLSQPEKLLLAAQNLPKLSEILPPETLRHRIGLIEKFRVKDWSKLETKIFLIASVNDLLIPSYAESERLLNLFPYAVRYISPYGGHGLLLERDIGLSQLILRSHDILSSVASCKSTLGKSYTWSKISASSSTESVSQSKETHPKFSSLEVIQNAREQLATYNKVFSPVFIGVDRVPEQQGRPILFVGNHTLYGITDVPFFIEHFLSKRNILVRALAHPIFWSFQRHSDMQRISSSSSVRNNNNHRRHSNSFLRIMESFGSVAATPRNLYRLLEQKEAVLLFPGGAREAFKRKDEAYSLHWPKEAEFVRMAIRHDAWIVPFSCVGPEDNFQIVLDGEELLRIPLLERWMKSLFSRSQMPLGDTVREWKGPLKPQDMVNFVQPLSLPRVPHRIYFYFSSPIDTRTLKDAMKDKSQVEYVYRCVESQVKDGISYLLRKRKEDPFGLWWKRVVFETLADVAAPTTWQWSVREGYLDV